jgi:hypothetical protein
MTDEAEPAQLSLQSERITEDKSFPIGNETFTVAAGNIKMNFLYYS